MRRRTSRLAMVLAALVLASVALSACGQTAAQQFRETLTPIQQQAANNRAQISGTLQGVRLKDPAGARLLHHQIAALASTLAGMANLRAPTPAAERAFLTYQASYETLVRSLDGVAARIGRGSAAQVRIAGAQATDAAGAVQRASDSLQSALGP